MRKISSCVLCGSPKVLPLYSVPERMLGIGGTFFFKKCSECFFIFLDPQPSQAELKKYYPSKTYYIYNKNSRRGPIELIREYLIKHYYSPNLISSLIAVLIKNAPAVPSYRKDGKILDLGCGTGDTIILLQELGWKVYGLDMDKKALEIGKKRGLKNLMLGTYEDIVKYPDNFFDAIRLYHVIEHLDNPLLCMKLIHKKLKRGGELIVGTPNMDSFASKMFKSYWFNLDSPRHLYIFTPKHIKKLVEKIGFLTRKIEYCSAGGIVGSLQYLINDRFNKNIDLVHKFPVIALFYPLEWIIDKFHYGDVFVIRASKK